ncbi:hypothetical protein [Granulosicoccus antarcticus]|uniref:hypothetical protein n=1 Tax=Granulosicoccus antarcticus TaxID=437505 RepID=UPI0012FE4417|nr:hypothetical protein [Granulosicoccus antarcticus]
MRLHSFAGAFCKALNSQGGDVAGRVYIAIVRASTLDTAPLPLSLAGSDEHIVFTTPYLLIAPGETEWLAYMDRVLPAESPAKRHAAYLNHMKYGPARNYWTEFVFEAYVNFKPEVIFLEGLPDVAESRPCSRINLRDQD